MLPCPRQDAAGRSRTALRRSLAETVDAILSPAPGTEPVPATPDPVAARMARAMIEANARLGGGCDASDLVEAGFSIAQIAEHEAEARRLARLLFVREHGDCGRTA